MIEAISRKAEAIQIPMGYTVAGGLTTTPIWVEAVTDWLQLGAVVIGIAVGITTIWLNIERIKKARK